MPAGRPAPWTTGARGGQPDPRAAGLGDRGGCWPWPRSGARSIDRTASSLTGARTCSPGCGWRPRPCAGLSWLLTTGSQTAPSPAPRSRAGRAPPLARLGRVPAQPGVGLGRDQLPRCRTAPNCFRHRRPGITRKWLTTVPSPEETATQTQVAFLAALDAEGLIHLVEDRLDHRVELPLHVRTPCRSSWPCPTTVPPNDRRRPPRRSWPCARSPSTSGDRACPPTRHPSRASSATSRPSGRTSRPHCRAPRPRRRAGTGAVGVQHRALARRRRLRHPRRRARRPRRRLNPPSPPPGT